MESCAHGVVVPKPAKVLGSVAKRAVFVLEMFVVEAFVAVRRLLADVKVSDEEHAKTVPV